ncbi:hypothetical protein [Brevundimonas sp.]|uniref:hypothetical protein n=1 Tax=Brevundimonas sp. TaxID=1871086 RepID=UPI003569AABF
MKTRRQTCPDTSGRTTPAPADDPGDPAALAQAATRASSRAMQAKHWTEAKALAGLAESYARLAEKGGRGGGGSIATIDLTLLYEIIADTDGSAIKRFQRVFDGRHDPDAAIKQRFWERVARRHYAVDHNLKELMFRAIRAEREVRRLGGTPRLNETDVEIEAWVRDWVGESLSEANLHHRTKLGEWPWR